MVVKLSEVVVPAWPWVVPFLCVGAKSSPQGATATTVEKTRVRRDFFKAKLVSIGNIQAKRSSVNLQAGHNNIAEISQLPEQTAKSCVGTTPAKHIQLHVLHASLKHKLQKAMAHNFEDDDVMSV